MFSLNFGFSDRGGFFATSRFTPRCFARRSAIRWQLLVGHGDSISAVGLGRIIARRRVTSVEFERVLRNQPKTMNEQSESEKAKDDDFDFRNPVEVEAASPTLHTDLLSPAAQVDLCERPLEL